jgi:UDP-N-acetylglucosamine 4,6-dehydratase/5-epimerase
MLDGKIILITGATGSFGKLMVKTILERYNPRKLIIFSRDELKQYEMAQVFSPTEHQCLRYFLGDVRDKERLNRALNKVDIVFHAAALKQVPAAEYNPFEAIRTNILGAQNIIECCIDQKVQRVIALSTDKAVNPINLYGATKLCSDKLFMAASAYVGAGNPIFSVVRYGNVLGSRGSVVPLFLKQKLAGEITVTDPRMTRFWITLEAAVNFVLNTLAVMQGSEVFIPKIPSMSIVDMAHALCPDCAITYTGLRPGEKLNESMISGSDSFQCIEYDTYYVLLASFLSRRQYLAEHGGTAVPDGFEYSSETNPEWLKAEDLLRMVDESKPLN